MKQIIIFFCSFLFIFSPTPILGIYAQKQLLSQNIFNYSYSLFKLNISSDKGKVILGSDGWLFLGNNYNQIIEKSTPSYQQTPSSITENEQFINKLHMKLQDNNIDFKFVVLPNKHSIYGHHIGLDTRLRAYSYYNSNTTIQGSDMTSYFRRLKNKTSHNLYFKTDTHWNDLGAFYGYQYIMKNTLNQNYKTLDYDTQFKIVAHTPGDLARFLNIDAYLSEKNVSVVTPSQEQVKRINVTTGVITHENIQGNISNSEIKEPIKVINKNAMNTLKVLWLHDSYGRVMSPYMHLTFSEVTHQHYTHAFQDMPKFIALVDNINPDLVILASVERHSFDFGRYLNEPMSGNLLEATATIMNPELQHLHLGQYR